MRARNGGKESSKLREVKKDEKGKGGREGESKDVYNIDKDSFQEINISK